jgi:hypothetical protein
MSDPFDVEKRLSRLEASQRRKRHFISPDIGWWIFSLLGALFLFLWFA